MLRRLASPLAAPLVLFGPGLLVAATGVGAGDLATAGFAGAKIGLAVAWAIALELNFATSAAGGLRIELQEIDGTPIPGFTLAESVELIGNEISRDAIWSSGADLGEHAGRPVRLRIAMRDADLHAFRFRPE